MIALEMNIFEKKCKVHRKQKCKINIYIIQLNNSTTYGYFCMGFIDFMLKGKTLFDCTNLLYPNHYENNDEIILKYIQQLKRFRWKNYIGSIVVSRESLKNLKYHVS